jgi:hypothetical protein
MIPGVCKLCLKEKMLWEARGLLTLAAVLLFFLLKPPKRPQAVSRERSIGAALQSVRPSLKLAPRAVRREGLRNNLVYQRIYVDHSCIRP